MMKLNKYLIFVFLFFLFSVNFSCQEQEDIDTGDFKKPVDMEVVNYQDMSFLLILDNKLSQLFFYDTVSECFLDFDKDIPLKNGLKFPKYPYKLALSSDNRKAVVISSDNTVSIISLSPYFDYYQKDCKQKTLPFKEHSFRIDFLPEDLIVRKVNGFDYEIVFLNKSEGFIEIYKYNEKEEFVSKEEFEKQITDIHYYNDYYYISFKNQKSILKYNSETSETINLESSELDYNGIDKFLIKDNHIYIYDKYNNYFLVWNTDNSDFEEIKGAYNPLDKNSPNPAKYLKLRYNVNSMSFYTQKYPLDKDEKLNDVGYLLDNQILEGDYVLITDNGGYFYFITLDTKVDLIEDYPDEDYESLEDYKEELTKRFLKYQIPLLTEYKPEILTVVQPDYCTQFNKYEANECFYVVNEDENSTNNRYIILSEEVKNRDFYVSGDYFKFIYDGALKDFVSDDGTFRADDKLFSQQIDFSTLVYSPEDLQLEIISPLPEDKEDDEKCKTYKTVDEGLNEGETNRKFYRLIPVAAFSGHNLTLSAENFPNLAYCYDQAFAFQLRVKNKFLVTSVNFGEIGISDYCTTDRNVNPLCENDSENCPQICENSSYYENELFKVKIFSDKGEMDIDSYIAFSLGVNSTAARYNDSLISPLKALYVKNTKRGKGVIAIIDSYLNNINLIDSYNFREVLTLIH